MLDFQLENIATLDFMATRILYFFTPYLWSKVKFIILLKHPKINAFCFYHCYLKSYEYLRVQASICPLPTDYEIEKYVYPDKVAWCGPV